jgi:taurine dioxygenase
VLRALQVPEHFGRTGFMDKILLHDTLDESIRARIADRRAVYRFEPRMDRNPYAVPGTARLVQGSAAMDSLMDRLERDFPPVSHPLVLTQRETGRKVLNFSPCYAVGIEGMAEHEADELLVALSVHCARGARLVRDHCNASAALEVMASRLRSGVSDLRRRLSMSAQST